MFVADRVSKFVQLKEKVGPDTDTVLAAVGKVRKYLSEEINYQIAAYDKKKAFEALDSSLHTDDRINGLCTP